MKPYYFNLRGLAIVATLGLLLLAIPAIAEDGDADPPPKTGNGMISFDGPNKDNIANKSGIVVITASHPDKADLRIEVPVAENAKADSVPAAAKFLAPEEWQDCLLAAANTLTLKGISKLDGDPGDTGLKMHWTTTNDIPVYKGDGKRRIRGSKNGDGGRGGQFTVSAAGLRNNPDGSVAVASAEAMVWFDPQDSITEILARLAEKLASEGWDFEYDPFFGDQLDVLALPSGEFLSSVTMGVAYSDDVLPDAVEYHWEIGFPQDGEPIPVDAVEFPTDDLQGGVQ